MSIKYIKQFSVLAIILFSLFALPGCKSKREIQLLSSKINELAKINETLVSEEAELKKSNQLLSTEIEALKADKQKLSESNINLQNENADLKKKLKAYEEKKQGPINTKTTKTAYLTFDDGPSDNTPKILDILKVNNIKATFFVNGHPERKDIYKRIINEGHTIGNHTYTHDYAALYKTIEGFDRDKQRLEDLIFEITDTRPQILRFPGGSNNHVSYSYGGTAFMDKLTSHVKQNGIKYFDWNVDSTDASVATQNKDTIIASVLNGSKNKNQSIILMHDSKPKTTTVQALPAIIKGLKEQGFSFSVLTPEVNAVQFK